MFVETTFSCEMCDAEVPSDPLALGFYKVSENSLFGIELLFNYHHLLVEGLSSI